MSNTLSDVTNSTLIINSYEAMEDNAVFTLPKLSISNIGLMYLINKKDDSIYSIKVLGNTGDKIDNGNIGGDTEVLLMANEFLLILSDGVMWRRIAK